MFFDPLYLAFALPGLLLALYATFKTKATFAKYAKVNAGSRLTGAAAAERLLSRAGVRNVKIETAQGFLSDHYDPSTRTLRLSPDVFHSTGLSAIGVACHEAGHALQHAQGYRWLSLRTALVPATHVSSWLSYIVITLGFIMASTPFILLGAFIFSAAVVFSIVTLPVEYDATRRAKELMVSSGVVAAREAEQAGEVLNAAFLTYVAAAVSSLLLFAYYLMRSGVFGRRGS
ncbi:MAG: zinc metallopeptidase [Fibrobacterota bacterium]